ncbi:MAG TPA: ATP-binding protein [Usitatibacter sp.]|nr:ATP-binding protein [Usitatibacter sp.]
MKSVPLRRRLLLLVAAALLPLAATAGLALYDLYVQQRMQAERSVLEVARALSTAVDAELRRTVSVLDALGTSASLERGELSVFQDRARRMHKAQEHWGSLLLHDRTGKRLFNTGVAPGTEVMDVVERASFDRVLAERTPAVGMLRRGPRGNWGVPVRVPVLRNGELLYVITAVLRPEAILAVLQRTGVPSDWVVAVSDRSGTRIARTASFAQTVGTPFSPTLRQMMEQGGREGTGVTDNSEEVAVFTAYTRTPETGWVTAVGLPVSAVVSEARQSFMTLGGGIVLSIALGVLVALLIARSINVPMAQLREVALRAGRGRTLELPATDIRELQDVGQALAESERERMQAEAERENLLHSEQQARAVAEAANRAKDEFLAMLGHELRNPLGAISNATAVLQHPATDETRRQDARDIIARQVAHLTRLTDDLLDAGRAVMGKIVLQRRPIDAAATARQALATLRTSGRTHNHVIRDDLEPAWVDADGIRLDQVLSNLVINAVKYSPAGSTIHVSVKPEGHDAVIRVRDEGIGIPPELAPRVFDLFVQGDRPLDRSMGGLGIGLTLVRRLAEMHGGSAEVRSEGDGKGSEFIVRLPAIPAPAGDAKTPALEATANARHVLIVEDNDDARETLRVLLELSGHRVHAEPDGERGLETALRLKPEVMLVDVGLPRMDGYELARRVRAADGWPVRPLLVAVTGYGQPADRAMALAAGFDSHLPKPVEPQHLIDLIATAPTSP